MGTEWLYGAIEAELGGMLDLLVAQDGTSLGDQVLYQSAAVCTGVQAVSAGNGLYASGQVVKGDQALMVRVSDDSADAATVGSGAQQVHDRPATEVTVKPSMIMIS